MRTATATTPTLCAHCGSADSVYAQSNGSLACIDCYWDSDDDYLTDRERAEQDRYDAIMGYCDWCEMEGHTFRTCGRRDDDVESMA